jgi:sarcosine reductase
MRLTLVNHPISEIDFGETTLLEGKTLTVGREELVRHLLEDERLQAVDLEIARPGDLCRIGVVFDILEPRAKAPGSGPDFPGILGPIESAGQGTTHVLRGAVVTVLDETAPVAAGKLIEMSGPAGEASPYSVMNHLIVIPRAVADLEQHIRLNALRLASVKASVFLARAALDQPSSDTEVFETSPNVPSSNEEDPLRFVYITQIHSRQRVAEVDEPILYGANTAGMVPVGMHPNEWLDGAVVMAYQNMGVETFFYQNHPVILELYNWQREGKITFAGTIASMAGSDNEDRTRNAMLAANMAKWTMQADAAALTKYGGGAPHADMALTARYCEELGVRTVVQTQDMSRDRRAESAVLFNYAEVDAIVVVGGDDTRWAVPAVEHVISSSSTSAALLGEPQELAASRICGIVGQQGGSHIRSFLY